MRRRRAAQSLSATPHGAGLSPLLVAGGVATVLALLLFAGPALRRWLSDRFNPHIAFQAGRAGKPPTAPAKSGPNSAAVFEGEVSRTEVRLREAGAVALAAALTGVALSAEGRPARDVAALLASLQQRGLLPPGVVLAGDGKQLAGVYGTLHLRLRPAPFAVEVLALGRERRDGPALLLRVPDEPGQANAPARYFSAFTLSHVRIPEPFASPPAILACGWQAAPLNPSLPDGADPAQLAAWARESTKSAED